MPYAGSSLPLTVYVDDTGLTGTLPSGSTTTSPEVQSLTAASSVTGFTVSFMGQTSTNQVLRGMTRSQVAAVIEEMTTVGRVYVDFVPSVATIPGAGAFGIYVYFNTLHGDLPPLTTAALATDVVVGEVNKGVDQTVVGVKPFSYLIMGLPQTATYVRVAAVNAYGTGPATFATVAFAQPGRSLPMTVLPSNLHPSAPRSISVVNNNAQGLTVAWTAPISVGTASGVSYYNVEWDILTTFDSQCGASREVQRIVFASNSATPTTLVAGGFKVVYNGVPSSCITYGTGMDTALVSALSGFGLTATVSNCEPSQSSKTYVASAGELLVSFTTSGDIAPLSVLVGVAGSCTAMAATAVVVTEANGMTDAGSVTGACDVNNLASSGRLAIAAPATTVVLPLLAPGTRWVGAAPLHCCVCACLM
jgi:hypothetical protein